MTLKLISSESYPNYIALSTDIIDEKIEGASIIGAYVYTTDTKKWYIITGDLTLTQINAPLRTII